MKAYFGRRYVISASHRLHTEALSPEENRSAYGKCNNPNGHGHNYNLEVLVGGGINRQTGMVINLADLDNAVRTTVLERFDHANLNLDPLFANQVSTTENFARAIFGLLAGAIKSARLEYVRVEETENNFFEFNGEASQNRPELPA